MTYKVSKDYKRLKQLLDQGDKVVCFVDFDWDRKGNIVTDIALAKCVGNGENLQYSISCRGIGYFSVYPLWYDGFTDEGMYKAFENDNVQFIDPEYDKNPLELEYKSYDTRRRNTESGKRLPRKGIARLCLDDITKRS